MREQLLKMIRGTPLETIGFEVEERLWLWRGIRSGTFSQHGEDRIIVEYFNGRTGRYVDVGANYPVKLSNTYLLYRQGWTGLTVEPIPRLSRRHRRFRPRDAHVNAAVSTERGELTFYEIASSGLSTFDRESCDRALQQGNTLKGEYKVPVWPLSELVDKHLGDGPIDLLSVDTEGYEMFVFNSIDWSRFRPQLIIFELNDGGSVEVTSLVESKGYRVYRDIACNRIMERVDGKPG